MNDREKLWAWYLDLMRTRDDAQALVSVWPGQRHSNDPGWEKFKRWVPRPSRDCRCYAKPANLLKLRVIQGGKQ
jgi:hypothetical protein